MAKSKQDNPAPVWFTALVICGLLYGLYQCSGSDSQPSNTETFTTTQIEQAPEVQSANNVTSEKVTVTKFNLTAQIIQGSNVKIRLDTDAPDNLMLSLSSYRAYHATDTVTKKQSENFIPYFEEDITAGELKNGKVYNLNHSDWKERFERENAPELGFIPNKISGNVVFNLYYTPNTQLGENSEKLTGDAVKLTEWGTKKLDSEKQLAIPLNYSIKKPEKSGVRVGMSKEQVLGSTWGKPQYKNITTGVYGTQEQWIYKGDNYLYFENDILTAIQNH